MAKFIPLPNYADLPEVVLFHRSHPSDQRLMLQVPTGPESAETYIIRLDQPSAEPGKYDPRNDHKGWIKRLPNSQALMDKLACDMHVAYYYSHSGTVMTLEDPDQIPWMTQVIAMAHHTAGEGPYEKMHQKRALRSKHPMVSAFRNSVSASAGRQSW